MGNRDELWVPDRELTVTLLLVPFMNSGSVVGTPSRYLGELGPAAAVARVVFASSVLTAGGLT
jgi:hypothetical protein